MSSYLQNQTETDGILIWITVVVLSQALIFWTTVNHVMLYQLLTMNIHGL